TTVKDGVTISTSVSTYAMAKDGSDQLQTRETTTLDEKTTEKFVYNANGTMKTSTAVTVKAGVTISTVVSTFEMGPDGRDRIALRVATTGNGDVTTEKFTYNADGTLGSSHSETVKAGIIIL